MKEEYKIIINQIVKQNDTLGTSKSYYSDYPENELSIDKIIKDKLEQEKYYKITIIIETNE